MGELGLESGGEGRFGNGVGGLYRCGESASGSPDMGELLPAGFIVGLNSGVIVLSREKVLDNEVVGDAPHCLSHRNFSCLSLCPRERIISKSLSQNFGMLTLLMSNTRSEYWYYTLQNAVNYSW